MNSEFLFERYLEGSMQPDELKAFETLIADNLDFARAFNEYKKVDSFLREQHAKNFITGAPLAKVPGNATIENDLKAYLGVLEEEGKGERELRKILTTILSGGAIPQERKFPFRRFIRIAAMFMLAISIGAVLWYMHRPASPQQIFLKYYAPYPCLANVRGDKSLVSDSMKLALEAYREKNYFHASELFIQISDDQTSQLRHLYLGICYLEMNNEKLALESFSKILVSPDSRFYIQALWYSGMTCLKFNDSEHAKEFLQEIPPELFDYSNKAHNILKRL